MPLVTFFSVLELPEKNRKEQPPPLVRRGFKHCSRDGPYRTGQRIRILATELEHPFGLTILGCDHIAVANKNTLKYFIYIRYS